MSIGARFGRTLAVMIPIVAAFVVIGVMLWVIQQTTAIESGPVEVVEAFWKSITSRGSFTLSEGFQGELSSRKVAGLLEFWINITLASLGLVLTFRAGLWNIGIEGQMMAGGLAASAFVFATNLREPILVIPLALMSAMLGGGLWALLAGFLKTRFGVNEIFTGVALNAIANQLTLQLISTIWRPADSDKAQYSRPIPDYGLLSGISGDFDVSLLALLITIAAIVVIASLLANSRWGLNLKAVGKNPRSALLLGVPVQLSTLSAMAICGALAGIGGAHRVLFTYENVRGQFTGGIGFFALLVVLLVGQRVLLVPIVSLVFAFILMGGTQLQFLGLDTSLSGVLQGTLVLFVLLFGGLQNRLELERQKRLPPAPIADSQAATGA